MSKKGGNSPQMDTQVIFRKMSDNIQKGKICPLLKKRRETLTKLGTPFWKLCTQIILISLKLISVFFILQIQAQILSLTEQFGLLCFGKLCRTGFTKTNTYLSFRNKNGSSIVTKYFVTFLPLYNLISETSKINSI